MLPAPHFLVCTSTTLLFVTLTTLASSAHASGNVERMAQVIVDPNDPRHVVVRYGAASAGLLFSSDGGHTFAASCSAAMDPELTLLSRQNSLYDSMLTMDGQGLLVLGDSSSVWYGDATGCTWTKQAALEGKWIADIARDPSDAEQVIALSITSTGEQDDIEARSDLVRRSADGVWSSVGTIKPHVPHQRVYASDLITGASALESRLYATVVTSAGADLSKEATSVVLSADGGHTWMEHEALPAAIDRLTLLAVDPRDLDRVLAVLVRDGAPDSLFVSDDQGKTFHSYADIQVFTGVTFDPSGRVFIADLGGGSGLDGEPSGGVLTAAQLGQPLVRLPNADDSYAGLDCIAYEPQTQKLMVCKANRLGLLDPVSGAFEELTRLDLTERLLQCEGLDVKALCEPQLNAGSSWCCTLHYPFTPFCGDYDVTKVGNRRVYCGLSGRAQDDAIGLGPASVDAGLSVPDASVADSATDAADKPISDAGGQAKAARSTHHGCTTSTVANNAAYPYSFALLLLLGRWRRPRARQLVAARRAR